MRGVAAVWMLLGTAAGVCASEPPGEDLTKRLTAAIREHCPDADISSSDKAFTAKHGTMMFTLHPRAKTGEVAPTTYQKEGPNFRGFMLSVTEQQGRYQGAAVVPQTLGGPYFPTYLDAPATEDGNGHYWITFSYGSRLDPALKQAIFDALPDSLRGSGAPTSGPPR